MDFGLRGISFVVCHRCESLNDILIHLAIQCFCVHEILIEKLTLKANEKGKQFCLLNSCSELGEWCQRESNCISNGCPT